MFVSCNKFLSYKFGGVSVENSLSRDFTCMWTKQAYAHPPPTQKHTERDVCGQSCRLGGGAKGRHAPVHLSPGLIGPLRSVL